MFSLCKANSLLAYKLICVDVPCGVISSRKGVGRKYAFLRRASATLCTAICYDFNSKNVQ